MKKSIFIPIFILFLMVFILGIIMGEPRGVWQVAVEVCLGCIGIQ